MAADGCGLTPTERGRLGGAPMTTGSVVSTYGGTLASVHVRRLRAIADASQGRPREHLLAAIECIQTLVRKNRRLGSKVGGQARRAVLTHRGVQVTGSPEDIAAEICELAGEHPVTVYRFKRKFRITTQSALVGPAEPRRVGVYDAGSDFRDVVADVRAVLDAEGVSRG